MSIRTRDPKPTERPTWFEYWLTVGNEDFLFARELIDLSPDVRAHFAWYTRWEDSPVMVDVPGARSFDPGVPDPEGWVFREAELDWKSAADAADRWPASSTQRRLLALVLSLVQPDQQWVAGADEYTGTRLMNVRDLSMMGSWREQVADIMSRYICGGEPRLVEPTVPDVAVEVTPGSVAVGESPL